jgi:putative ABC transport system permease protein
MKFLPLIWRTLLRRKIRTTFTALSIFVAFVLFSVLMAIRVAFTVGVDVAGVDRLLMFHKVSIIQFLPVSYLDRLKHTEGVADATYATWFGGIYRDPKNFFPQYAVEPEAYLRMYPEFLVPEDQKKAWFADRMGAVVGRATATRFGWKVGDRVPLQGTIFRPRQGNGTVWEFTIRGIYDGARPGDDTTQFLLHSKYLEEGRTFAFNMVGWYFIRVTDPAKSAEIAKRIDAEFANSEYETKTSTEKAFAQSFANQIGDIGTIMIAIASAVFFTILLVAANTMAQSIRERVSELAVLKTLGYSNSVVMALVLAESLLLAVGAGWLGLAVGVLLTTKDPTNGLLPAFFLPGRDLALGVMAAMVLGLSAGAVPATRAVRLRIVDALRRS